MKKKVLVSGCNGHMGKLVVKAINSSDDMCVIAGFDNSKVNNEFPVFSSISEISTNLINTLTPDIIIDFSSPEGTRKISKYALNSQTPIVIATTGLANKDILVLKDYSKQIPIFQSANMSFNIALLKRILKTVSNQITNADIEIIETHHKRKKDSPSGTAKMFAETINESFNNTKAIIYGREGKREENEIGISSLRGGNIAGEHIIKFFSDYETLEFKHTTYSPKVFIEGTLQATRFLLTKNNGFYNMDNLLSI